MKRVRPFPFDRVPRLARAQVEAGRALMAHLPLATGEAWATAQAAAGGIALELVECYVFPSVELSSRSAGVRFEIAAGARGRVGLAVIDPRLAPRLARRALGVADEELAAPRPLSPAERGALAFLVTALLDGSGLHVAPLGDDEPDAAAGFSDPWVLALDAQIHGAAGTGWARLLGPERLRLTAPSPSSLTALRRRGARLADASISLRLVVGRTRLARRDFAELQPRDVLLFDHFGPRPPLGGPVELRLGAGGFAAQLGGDGLTLLAPFRLGESTMSTPRSTDPDSAPTDHPASDAPSDALLRELPVEVACELGRVTLTGRELLELQPGAVIPVGRPLAGPVDLTVGGRVVARGELVDVEGEIGVRVTQIEK